MIAEEEFRNNNQLTAEGNRVKECRGWYLDLKGRKWQKAGEECIMRSFTVFTACQVLFWVIWSREACGTDGRGEKYVDDGDGGDEDGKTEGRILVFMGS